MFFQANFQKLILFGIVAIGLGLFYPRQASAQSFDQRQYNRLERRVDSLEHSVRAVGDTGGISFLFGAFCALWAQNTGRSPWLWFFMGLLFSVITIIVLLNKNSTDNFDRKVYGRATRDLSP